MEDPPKFGVSQRIHLAFPRFRGSSERLFWCAPPANLNKPRLNKSLWAIPIGKPTTTACCRKGRFLATSFWATLPSCFGRGSSFRFFGVRWSAWSACGRRSAWAPSCGLGAKSRRRDVRWGRCRGAQRLRGGGGGRGVGTRRKLKPKERLFQLVGWRVLPIFHYLK